MNIMTLTEVSYYVRKYMPHVVLGAIIFMIIFYVIQITIFLFKAKNKSVFTNPVFGEIKAPQIKDASSSAGIKFQLDTVEGEPITATESARVFFIPPQFAKFGYRENVFLMAQTIGIDTQAAKFRLVDKQANFETDNQKLTVDIGNFNFNYQLMFDKLPELFDAYNTPTSEEATGETSTFLQSIGRYPEELSTGETNTIYFFYDAKAKTLRQVERNIDANLVEVDLFRPKVDGLPVVTPKFPNSQNFVLGYFNGQGDFRVLRAQIAFFERSAEQVGIYPLKSGQTAYDDLQKGAAMVVANPSNDKEVSVKKMFLAYFDPDSYQDYLQPVYVFVGDDNFVAFVPAIKDEFLTN